MIGDVDGDGVADLIVVDHCKIVLWINQGGNGWSDPIEIDGTPGFTNQDDVRLVDVLGTGVAGILWRSRSEIGIARCVQLGGGCQQLDHADQGRRIDPEPEKQERESRQREVLRPESIRFLREGLGGRVGIVQRHRDDNA